MARLKLKFRDISRMTKKYPYVRHLPRTQLVSDKSFELEVIEAKITASNVLEHVVTFEKQFEGIPSVTATVVGTDSTDFTAQEKEMVNVNVWIKQVTTKNVTLAFSDDFKGTISIQAIRFT